MAVRFGVSSTVKNDLPRYSNFWDGTAVYTPVTTTGSYDAITSTTSSGANSYTFSGIPSNGYKHLQLRIFWYSTADTGSLRFRFNGDTGSNYASHDLIGEGVSARSLAESGQTNVRAGLHWEGSAGKPVPYIVDILDFANISKNKTMRTLYGVDKNGSGEIGLSSGLWMSTSAINSITFYEEYGNTSSTGFSAALYGVKG